VVHRKPYDYTRYKELNVSNEKFIRSSFHSIDVNFTIFVDVIRPVESTAAGKNVFGH